MAGPLTFDVYGQASSYQRRAEAEQPDERPNCGWPVKTKKDGIETTEKCKSEKNIFSVTGKGLYTGRERKTDICGEHVGDAMKKWKWESAEKYPTKRTGD